jgi:glutamine amidotransferase
MLAVIDYGAGNLRSVLHALNHLQAENVRVVRSAYELRGAEKVILPGVGAFGAGMEKLEEQGLVNPIREAVYAGTPYLGICLGMQFLFDTSDEMGDYRGLGLLPGVVTRLTDRGDLKIPHMGWNRLEQRQSSALFRNVSADGFAYFVHSYHCVPAEDSDITVTVEYGGPIVAAVQRDHVYGVQFHPEKSQQTGLQVLTNFLEL